MGKVAGAGNGLVYCGKRPLTYFSSLTCSVASVVYLGTKDWEATNTKYEGLGSGCISL